MLSLIGPDSGIGFETAQALAGAGARIYLGSLSQERARVAAGCIWQSYPSADLKRSIFDLGDLVSTGIDQDSWLLRLAMRLYRPFSHSPAQAAATSVWLALSAFKSRRQGLEMPAHMQ